MVFSLCCSKPIHHSQWGPQMPSILVLHHFEILSLLPQKSHRTEELIQQISPCLLAALFKTEDKFHLPISSQCYAPFSSFLYSIFHTDLLQWPLIRFWAQQKVKPLKNILFMVMQNISSIHRMCIKEWKTSMIYISVQFSSPQRRCGCPIP